MTVKFFFDEIDKNLSQIWIQRAKISKKSHIWLEKQKKKTVNSTIYKWMSIQLFKFAMTAFHRSNFVYNNLFINSPFVSENSSLWWRPMQTLTWNLKVSSLFWKILFYYFWKSYIIILNWKLHIIILESHTSIIVSYSFDF